MIFAFLVEQLPLTELLNHSLAGPVNTVLQALGIPSSHPEAPITNFVAMELLVAVILFLVFLLVRSRISVDNPGGLQHMFEGVEGFVQSQSREIIGHHSEQFTPFLATLGLFILTANLIGVIPAFESPTANPAVPLGCAICTFLYYNGHGVRKQGAVGYLKHFMGPPGMPWYIGVPLAIVMFPIEIVSHLARLLSLTVRLFANMFAGDMVTLVFFSLVPVLVPVVFLALHIGVSFLQAYIFILLTMVYLSGAVAEEH